MLDGSKPQMERIYIPMELQKLVRILLLCHTIGSYTQFRLKMCTFTARLTD